MKFKELNRNEWIKTFAGTLNTSLVESATVKLLTPKILAKNFVNINDLSNAEKKMEFDSSSFKTQFSLAFEAFHEAEKKGLFTIQLKDVFEAPLAQRRHHKRSTSSNASSESNQSSNSICSSLSTSTTSMNTTVSNNQYSTPTKKCPTSCGKLSESTVFNFNDSYVSEYLKQQQPSSHTSQNQVFNRPITRSITHHNNKVFDFNQAQQTVNTTSDLCLDSSGLDNKLSDDASLPSEMGNGTTELAQATALNPPPSKRMKRCSTILID